MRTVTFSDPATAAYINATFVPTWRNRGDSCFYNNEMSTEESIFRRAQEIYATRNIATFFVTPEEKVVEYLAGYYSPDVFMGVAKFAEELRRSGTDGKKFAELHGKYRAVLKRSLDEIKATGKAGERESEAKGPNMNGEPVRIGLGTPPHKASWNDILRRYKAYKFNGEKHVHSEDCFHHLTEGLNHLIEVSAAFSATGPKELDELKANYKSGNRFSEEHSRKEPTEEGRGKKKDKRSQVETKTGKGKGKGAEISGD